jgi:uncharacterized protein (TIGR00288 family)
MHSRRNRPAGNPSPPARGSVAPVYRGPQATPYHTHGGMATSAPNAALLIDFDNVTMGIRSDLQTELKNLLSSDIVRGKVSVQRAYADWRRYPQYIVPLSEASIDLIFAPAYGSSKKNATDIRLAIDALELVFTRPEIGTFILLSGDSDFSSLVIKLKEYGKYVIGVGIRESSSDLLVQNCDEYYSYNALAGLVKTGEEESVKWDPWELVSEAVKRMKRNGDVMRADRLKQVMQQIDSDFDEGNVGMSKFSRFVSEAAQKGLLTLRKLENGQIEIDEPGKTETATAAPVAAAAPANGTAERTRERGRGRRGRGRGREREETPTQEGAAADIGEKLDAAAAAHPAAQGGAAEPAVPQRQAPPGVVARVRGLGPRGLRARDMAPPPELLSVGVVELAPAAGVPVLSDNGEVAPPKTRRRTRGRKTAAKKAATPSRSTEAADAAAAPAAEMKPRKTRPAGSRGRGRKQAAAKKTE